MNSLLLTDSYKISHHYMYPEGTEKVYSNLTARSDKFAPKYSKGGVISFFQQGAMRKIHKHFKKNFFDLPKEQVISEVKEAFSAHVGADYCVKHFEELHDLGYLPIKVKAIPEGMFVPIKVPYFTIINTDNRFYWLVNYLETLISNTLWQPITVATIVKGFKDIARKWYDKNDADNKWFLDFALHNFAMRGMSGLDAATDTALAFAIHSKGSDTLPVISAAKELYDEVNCPIFSLPATEHAVASSNIIFNSRDVLEDRLDGEKQFLKRLITKVHPTGMVSYVADTYDLWSVVTEILPALKDDIISRDGKLIIRPDSSPTTPADIICGFNSAKQYFAYDEELPEAKGLVELLWDIFGGTTNKQGYKILDSHIGFIYGEGISQDMLEEIYQRLDAKGFAASNVVVGIGSYPQTYVTRDTYGQAIKATAIQIKGELFNIYKDPKTSGSFNKKSAKGLMRVNVDMTLVEECSWDEENQGILQVIYEDGKFHNTTTLSEIRERLINI